MDSLDLTLNWSSLKNLFLNSAKVCLVVNYIWYSVDKRFDKFVETFPDIRI